MNNPAQTPPKRRPQIFNDDEERMQAAVEALKKENLSLKTLLISLSSLIIKKAGGKNT